MYGRARRGRARGQPSLADILTRWRRGGGECNRDDDARGLRSGYDEQRQWSSGRGWRAHQCRRRSGGCARMVGRGRGGSGGHRQSSSGGRRRGRCRGCSECRLVRGRNCFRQFAVSSSVGIMLWRASAGYVAVDRRRSACPVPHDERHGLTDRLLLQRHVSVCEDPVEGGGI